MIGAPGNPVLLHRWGLSPGADRVWSQIAGIAPSAKAWERAFMAIQVFIDDSYSQAGAFVLGGYVASAESWARLSEEWERLLPLARKNNKGRHRFKMTEMAHDMAGVALFYRVIEKHVLMSISCRIDLSDFNRALRRIYIPGRALGWTGVNLHVFLINYFMTVFHVPLTKVNPDTVGDPPQYALTT